MSELKERLKTKNKKKPDITVPELEDEPTRTSDEQREDRKIIKRNKKRQAAKKASVDAEKESVAPIKRRLKNKGKLNMQEMLSGATASDEPRKKMKGLYGDWLG
tara:strand:+ start:583 stop:894 length:312 start_codon:yes stop_codon:yes gene_type:complete